MNEMEIDSSNIEMNNEKTVKKGAIETFDKASNTQKRYYSENELITPENAALKLSVSRSFIYKLIRNKKIDIIRTGKKNGRIKILKNSFNNYKRNSKELDLYKFAKSYLKGRGLIYNRKIRSWTFKGKIVGPSIRNIFNEVLSQSEKEVIKTLHDSKDLYR